MCHPKEVILKRFTCTFVTYIPSCFLHVLTHTSSLSHENKNYQIINVTVKIDEIKKNKINKTSKKPDNKMSETLHNLSDISIKWKIQNIKRCFSESPSFFSDTVYVSIG